MAESKTGPFAQYLHDVQTHLRSLTPTQRERVLQELDTHLQDAAHHAGADPHDAVFQAQFVQQMGSSRRLGRALARIHRSPQQRYDSMLNLIGGAAALFSLLLAVVAIPFGFLMKSEKLMVDMLTAAPVALIPTMLVLHWVYRPVQPRQSRWVFVCGMLGMLPFLFLTVWHDLIELIGFHDTVLHLPIDVLNASQMISTMVIGMVGIWFVLIGRLSKTTEIPAHPQFAWMSMATGASILVLPVTFVMLSVIVGRIAPARGDIPPVIQTVLTPLAWVTILWWFVCHLGWTLGTGLWLLQRRTSGPIYEVRS